MSPDRIDQLMGRHSAKTQPKPETPSSEASSDQRGTIDIKAYSKRFGLRPVSGLVLLMNRWFEPALELIRDNNDVQVMALHARDGDCLIVSLRRRDVPEKQSSLPDLVVHRDGEVVVSKGSPDFSQHPYPLCRVGKDIDAMLFSLARVREMEAVREALRAEKKRLGGVDHARRQSGAQQPAPGQRV